MIDQIDILEFGIFRKSPGGNFNEADAESPTGYYIRTNDILLVKQTSVIKAAKGVVFGIKYVPVSLKKSGIAHFECKITHPQLVDPKSNVPFSVTVEDKLNEVNQPNFDFYEFEHEWEMREGAWRFLILEHGKLLYEHEFTVEKMAREA